MANGFEEISELARDLRKAPIKALPTVRKIVERTAIDTKKELRAEAEGIAHAPRFPSAITYDIYGLTAEIGPEEGGQGSLALLYFGNSRTGPVLPDPMFALKRNAKVADLYFDKLVAETFK